MSDHCTTCGDLRAAGTRFQENTTVTKRLHAHEILHTQLRGCEGCLLLLRMVQLGDPKAEFGKFLWVEIDSSEGLRIRICRAEDKTEEVKTTDIFPFCRLG